VVPFPAGIRDFSPLQSGSGSHSVSYEMGNEGFFHGEEAAGALN